MKLLLECLVVVYAAGDHRVAIRCTQREELRCRIIREIMNFKNDLTDATV
jgi:hypothetical protein